VRRFLSVTVIVGLALAGLGALAEPAGAATITTPSTNPFVVPGDAGGIPQAFTVSGAGFTAGANVFIEQCDGIAPTAQGWDPTINCDLGTSPAAAIADGSGNVTFDVADLNHKFTPFKGPSPQGIFNCLSLNDPSPNNGLPDHRLCKVRLSTNNSASTSDQVFLPIVLPDDPSTPQPPPLRFGIGNVSVLEGTSGNRAVAFTVTLSRKSPLPVTVDYQTVAGTAKAPSDFVARTGTLTIPANATAAVVNVQVKGNAVVEPNETFKLRISNPSSGGIKRGNGTATILNDDPPRAGIRVGVGNATVVEGNSGNRSLRFTISLSSAPTQSVRVRYATTAGTATAGTDYTTRSGNVTIGVGKTATVVTVPVKGDSGVEPNETFTVRLTNPLRAVISRPVGSASILNDD
jgi:hypothetical protein